MARVDAVIDVLGLTKSKETIIGGYFRRGISGGRCIVCLYVASVLCLRAALLTICFLSVYCLCSRLVCCAVDQLYQHAVAVAVACSEPSFNWPLRCVWGLAGLAPPPLVALHTASASILLCAVLRYGCMSQRQLIRYGCMSQKQTTPRTPWGMPTPPWAVGRGCPLGTEVHAGPHCKVYEHT